MDVPVFFKSNRGARKMNFKGFQYPKDRQTDTERAIKIYWRCENRNCKGRITTVNDVPIHRIVCIVLRFNCRRNFDIFRQNFDGLS